MQPFTHREIPGEDLDVSRETRPVWGAMDGHRQRTGFTGNASRDFDVLCWVSGPGRLQLRPGATDGATTVTAMTVSRETAWRVMSSSSRIHETPQDGMRSLPQLPPRRRAAPTTPWTNSGQYDKDGATRPCTSVRKYVDKSISTVVGKATAR